MYVVSLRRLGRVFGPAAVLVLGCGPGGSGGDGGTGTGSTSAEDGSADGSDGTGTTGTSTDAGSDGGGSSTTGTQDTSTTTPGCGPIQLADIAQGVGGFILDGEAAGDDSGDEVRGAGDVNGDGIPDLIVGAPEAEPNGQRSGRAYVVFGKQDTEAISLADVTLGIGGFAMDGEGSFHYGGDAVSGAGDVNGDGLDDVIVGARGAEPSGAWSGRAYVVFGKQDTDKVSLADVAAGIGGFAMDGEGSNDEAGVAVSGAGDINGDGLDDVVVGAPGALASGYYGDSAGRTYVVFGKADTDLVSLADVLQGVGGFAMDGDGEADLSGVSVGGAGDVNGDGLADVVVGAPKAAPVGLFWAGRSYVVFGKADTDPVLLADVGAGIGGFVMDGETNNDEVGRSVSGADDMNGDGLDDVVIGAGLAGPIGDNRGRTYVVFGKADTDAVLLSEVASGIGGFAMEGEAAYDGAGWSVSGAGDVNGDGIPDVLVGAAGALEEDPEYGVGTGRTYVVFGRASTDMVSLADVALGVGGFALDGEAPGDASGGSVSLTGDLNGDGFADILIGATRPNLIGDKLGRTYLVFGGDLSCEGG